jgi:hypothetical protein
VALNLCNGSEKISSNSDGFAPKAKQRQKFGMLFSPHNPYEVLEGFNALVT